MMEMFWICISVVSILVVIFAFILVMRYFSYRETKMLAEKGLVRADMQRRNGDKGTLRWGIIIAAVGLAICLGLWPIGFTNAQYPLGLGPWMLFGLLPLFFGLALILIYVLTRDDKKVEAPRDDRMAMEPLADDRPDLS